jgi:hypothetical protein
MSEAKFIKNKEQLEKLAPVAAALIKHHVFICNGNPARRSEVRKSKPRFKKNCKKEMCVSVKNQKVETRTAKLF